MDVHRALIVSFSLILLSAAVLAAQPAASRPRVATGRPLVVCYGDSITAGLGLLPNQAFPADLARDLDHRGYHYQVSNQGTSGATSKDALASLPFILRLHPAAIIVEFGGNDGLRGLPLSQTRDNLDAVLTALQKAHIKILLAGITLPPNYGSDYIHQFDQIFRTLAQKHHVAIVPMIYKNLIHVPGTIQPDGIHPTTKGAQIIAQTLLPALVPLLRKGQ